MIYWVLGEGGAIGRELVKQLPSTAILYTVSEPFIWQDIQRLNVQIDQEINKFQDFVKARNWTLIYAAGVNHMGSSQSDVQAETRLISLLFLKLQLCHKSFLAHGRIVFMSSAGGIYAGHTNILISEKTQVHPTTPYGEGKVLQESIFIGNCSKLAIPLYICRVSTVYGGVNRQGRSKGLIAYLRSCYLERRLANIFVPLDTIRDYIHVEDTAIQVLALLACPMPATGHIIKIIASEFPASISQIISIFNIVTARRMLIVTSVNELSHGYRCSQAFKSEVCVNQCSMNRVSLLHGISRMIHRSSG